MKQLLIFLSVLMSYPVSAQPEQAEIRKAGIRKIIKEYVYADSILNYTTVSHYDKEGKELESYSRGELYYRNAYEKDQKGRILKIIKTYKNDEKVVTEFTYQADGRFIKKETDSRYNLTDTYWYSKEKRLIRFQVPDGSIREYKYNNKGLLVSIKNLVNTEGAVNVDITHEYNDQLQRVKTISKGDFFF